MPITPAQLRSLATRLVQDGTLNQADVDELVDATLEDGTLSADEAGELKSILSDFSDQVDTAATQSRLAAFLDIQDGDLRGLMHSLERDDGVIDASDVQQLLDHAGADGDISGSERASLGAMLLAATLGPDARRRLAEATATLEGRSTPNLDIPDASPVGVEDRITLPAGSIESLEVDVDIDHTYRNDLVLKLVAPDGTTVVLQDQSGGSRDDLRGSFPRTLTPVGDLSVFRGRDAAGEWTLQVSDRAGADVGKLESWGLRVTTAAGGGGSDGARPLDPTGNHRPVFLTDKGFFVEDPAVSEPADDLQLGDGLFRMAQLVDDMKDNPLALASLSLDERRTVLDNLQDALLKVPVGGAPPAGMNETQALQMRASVATVMMSLLEATGNGGAERDFKQEVFGSFTRALAAETQPTLRDSMIWQLDRVAESLPAGIRADAKELVNEIAPLSPPYDEWFKDGNDTLNVSWKTGPDEEFYPGTVDLLKKRGFEAEGAEPERGPAIYRKTITNDDGVETTIRIHMAISRNDVFDTMADDSFHVVGYDGHSDIGRNIPRSLSGSPDADGAKLVFYGLCAGKDVLNRVRDRYADAQVLTTFNSSYFNTGTRDGKKIMTRSENFNVLMELTEGAAHRSSWEDINENIKDNAILYPWHHPMPGRNNYISPVHTKIRRKVLDTDHDGQADYLDKLVNFDTFNVATDTAREFQAIPPTHPYDKLDGTVPHMAAMALNTATGYNNTTQGWKKQQILGDGYFNPGPDDKDIVRFERAEVDGLPTLKMKVNANYAHMSVEGLRAVAHYALIQMNERPDDPVDKKLMGLVFAAFSVNYDDAWWSRDNQIWEGLLSHLNLPSDIPLSVIKSILDKEKHDYSGNMGHVREWKNDIPQAALDALARDDVGVPG